MWSPLLSNFHFFLNLILEWFFGLPCFGFGEKLIPNRPKAAPVFFMWGRYGPQKRFPNASTAPARFYVALGFILVPRRLQTCVKMLPKCSNHGQQHVLWAAASVMLAGTSDHVHWTARDPSRHDLTLPQTIGLANCGQSKFGGKVS